MQLDMAYIEFSMKYWTIRNIFVRRKAQCQTYVSMTELLSAMEHILFST